MQHQAAYSVSSSVNIDQTRSWIARKLADTPLEHDPFPHLIIENFFPPAVYSTILQVNPFRASEGNEWISRPSASSLRSETPFWHRKQIALPPSIEGLDREIDRFWTEVAALMQGGDWFFERIREKCRAYLSYRYGPLAEDADFRSFFKIEHFLQRHDAGYFIGPHTDVPHRVATCIFSFADRDGYEEYGTQLCIPLDRLVRCSGRSHHKPDEFRVVKVAPYKPNNFLLFLKTPHSFHSVRSLPAEVPSGRFGMQFQIYQRQVEIFRDLTPVRANEGPGFLRLTGDGRQKRPETR